MAQPSTRRLVTEAALAVNQSTQDTIITNHKGRIESLETLGGIAPGNTSDAAVRDLILNPATNTATEIKARYVGKGEQFIDVRYAPYNAGQGAADDSAAINTAAADALTAGKTLLMVGTFNATGTVTFKCNVDASAATINYTGTGLAVLVGTDSSGVYVQDKNIRLPKLVNVSAPAGTWDGTSEGVRVVNANQCRVWVPRVETFERGLVVMGNGGGTAYTDFYLGSLWVNHENLVLDQGAAGTGWANQNNFYGGRSTHSTARGISDDPNASLLRLGNKTGGVLNPPDGNSFYGLSMEGVNSGAGGWARNRVINYGRFTQFFNCRWETSAGAPVIDSRDYAGDVIVWGGYQANKLSLTGIKGAVTVRDGVEGLVEAVDTTAPTLTTATDTTLKTWVSPTLSKCAYDSSTGLFTPAPGRWRIKARVTFPSNATGTRIVRLYAGAVVLDQAIVGGNGNAPVSLVVDKSFKFDGATTFKIVATQTSGADMALTSTSPYVNLQAIMS